MIVRVERNRGILKPDPAANLINLNILYWQMDGAERRRKLEEIRNNNQQLRRLVS